jgi:hypothetical protein
VAESAQILVPDECHRARDKRAEGVVHDFEMKALQVGDVAGDVERHDLPLALRGELVAAGEALDDHAAFGRPVSVPDEILILADGPDRHGQFEGGTLLFVREFDDALQLTDQPAMFWV